MKNSKLTTVVIGVLLLSVNAATAQTAPTPAPDGAAPAPAPATDAAAVPATGTVPVTTTTTATAGTEQLAPIYVTGSAIPTTDTQGALPVTTIDAATIEKRGYQTVTDILRNTPSNGSGANPGQTSGAFAPGAAYASLRGLGPQATLVLINGRRVANYAAPGNGQFGFVDLNNIPAQIVDRVEILTEGTSLYGADAVAGVVNIITKKNLGSELGEVIAYVGQTEDKDAFEQRYTVMGNLNSFDKNGYGVVEADYEHQNSIFAGDRDYSKSANQSNGGFDLRSGRTYPGQFQVEVPGGGFGGGGDFFSILPGSRGQPLTGTTNATDPHVDDNANALQGFDYNPYSSIIPETEHYGTYMNYTYKFYDGNITPNIDFSYRHNRTILTQAPTPFIQGDSGPTSVSENNGNVFIVPINNPFNQTGQVIDILSYRFTDIGPRIEKVDNDVFRAVPSVDFKLGEGWTLNVGFNYNYSYVNDRSINAISAANFQAALNSTDPTTAYNPFTSAGGNSQSVIDGLRTTSYTRSTTSLIGEDFRLNGKLFDLPAGPVQMAFGGEYRLDRYNQYFSDADAIGDVLGSTIQRDTAASRKSLSGYAQVDIPLTSPSFNAPGFYKIDIQVAGRVDKYSTFGSTENPNVSLRWETIPGLVYRASYAKAFRAPSLPELFAGGNQSVQQIFDPNAPDGAGGTGAFRDVTINGGGNPKLKPETAEVFSTGIAYQPDFVKGLLFTADYFKIRYSQQILQQDAQTLIDEGSPNVVLNPDGTIANITASYSNLSSSYIDGIDFGVNYVIGDPYKDLGQLTFTLNSTLIFQYVTDDGTGAFDTVGLDSGGVGPYSRYRQDTTVTWDYHNFELTLANNYSSGYADSSVSDFGIYRNVAAYITFDLQAAYTFDKEEMSKWMPLPKSEGFDWKSILAGTRIAVGCNNLYNFTPPFTANPADNLGYDPSFSDPTGRFFYAQISKKF